MFDFVIDWLKMVNRILLFRDKKLNGENCMRAVYEKDYAYKKEYIQYKQLLIFAFITSSF